MAKSSGWVKISRELLDSSIWKTDKPFDERSAWIDLILMANHEDGEFIDRQRKLIKIPRGSLYTSTGKLAQRWHWSRNKVIRYLGTLTGTQMVTQTGTQTGTLLTLVNYDKFQGRRTADGAADGTSYGAADGARTRNKEEYKEEKNSRSRSNSTRNKTQAEKMAAIEERRQKLLAKEAQQNDRS